MHDVARFSRAEIPIGFAKLRELVPVPIEMAQMFRTIALNLNSHYALNLKMNVLRFGAGKIFAGSRAGQNREAD
jgi:hypothetical protein